MALADYYGLTQTNFSVAAMFDADEKKIGKKIGDVEIFDIKDFARIAEKDKIDVAVIAVPALFAQQVLEQITTSGNQSRNEFCADSFKSGRRRENENR